MSGRRTALRGEPQARLRSRSGSAAIIAFAGVLGLLGETSICAEEPAPAANGNGGADNVQIPRVTVTARRREEAEQDVPEMITAVTGDPHDRSGTDRVEELNPLFPSSNIQFGT